MNAAAQLPLRALPLLWLGSRGGLEAGMVNRAGLPFRAIRGSGLHGVGWRLPLNALDLVLGLGEAIGLVRAYQPDVLLVTGGFITVPAALAAWLQGVPVLVYLPDIEPGLAVKLIARLARRIAVTVEDSRRFFSGREVVVTGYPTRAGLEAASRAQAQAHFGLEPHRPTLLVTGGSRGARSLNRAVLAALPGWLKDYQVIHLSGELDWAEVELAKAALPADLQARYHAFPFLHEMGLALAAADLVVSRAGASALGEYSLFGLPAILVPYPYAWRYQKVNADYLAERGAALVLKDEDLAHELAGQVRALLGDPARLAAMRAASRAAARPGAAERIAAELKQIGRRRP
ncbi:MAG: UDP-N-acetylglucosamine--N-acetylmuramyl-(pentapeptide) pyrophosphoryl-undecaprenol N-acetylglucosamine transferase [Anaerolineales bacterium]